MDKRIHVFILIISSVTMTWTIQAQQLASWSSFHETGFMWNPALTAQHGRSELSGTHRQEWLGYDDAPQVTTLSFQIPFFNGRSYGGKKYNTVSKIGVYAERDRVGPFENYAFGAAYAYKFKPGLQPNGIDDELSLGFSLKGGRYQFNSGRLTLFNPNEASLPLPEPSYEKILPNVSMGIYYRSRTKQKKNDNSSFYFGGISFNQLIPGKALYIPLGGDFGQSWDIRLKPHVLLNGGYTYFPFRGSNFIETNITGLYSFTASFQAMASSRYVYDDTWWLSGGAVTNGAFFVQTGVIFDSDSKLKKIVKGGELRIGIKGDFHAGKVALLGRTGYELYVAYTFNVIPE